MRYFDTSAVAKLFLDEQHASPIRQLMADRTASVSSVLLRIELERAIARQTPQRLDAARLHLLRFQLVPMDDQVVAHAATVQPSELRSLDAIHLATALSIRDDLKEFVTYDRQLGAAAAAAGLTVVAPGLDV